MNMEVEIRYGLRWPSALASSRLEEQAGSLGTALPKNKVVLEGLVDYAT